MISVIVNKHGILINYISDATFLADERGLSNICYTFFWLSFGCKLQGRLFVALCNVVLCPSFHTEECHHWKEIQGRKCREKNIRKKRETCMGYWQIVTLSSSGGLSWFQLG